jgi:hypothetical protein
MGKGYNPKLFFRRQSLPYALRPAAHATGEWSIRIDDTPERGVAAFADPHEVSLNGDRTTGVGAVLLGKRFSQLADIR